MKTWKTIALSVITTSALATGGALTYSYLQPSHYEGDTFTNAKTTISSTTTTSSLTDSNTSTSTPDSSTNTNPVYTESNSNEIEQNTGDRAYQPTFKVECVSTKLGMYTVEHTPTGDKCKAISYEQAESFCTYMEQIAHGKTSLSYTMDENYDTWVSNN